MTETVSIPVKRTESAKRNYLKNREKRLAQARVYYLANKEKVHAYQREYKRTKRRGGSNITKSSDRRLDILWGARDRARKYGREFNLTLEDIVIPEVCPIMGMPIVLDNPKAKWNSPALDRINNDLGYVPGNVRVISHRANGLKSSMSIPQVEKLLEYMRSAY